MASAAAADLAGPRSRRRSVRHRPGRPPGSGRSSRWPRRLLAAAVALWGRNVEEPSTTRGAGSSVRTIRVRRRLADRARGARHRGARRRGRGAPGGGQGLRHPDDHRAGPQRTGGGLERPGRQRRWHVRRPAAGGPPARTARRPGASTRACRATRSWHPATRSPSPARLEAAPERRRLRCLPWRGSG